MVFIMFSRLAVSSLRRMSPPVSFRSVGSSCGLTVKHERANHRFTVSPDSGPEAHGSAVLHYRFTGEKEVDLMSTYVPEAFRGRGVAALLSQAAMDFLVEENLKARVSCWYIKKYIEAHPLKHFKDLIIT